MLCGTAYPNYAEYFVVVVVICILFMNVFTQALCYPRSLRQVICGGVLPRLYKREVVANRLGAVSRILDRRVNAATGEEEFKVQRELATSTPTSTSRTASEGQAGGGQSGGGGGGSWEARNATVLDGAGPLYGERGGLFGCHEHGAGSSRDRINTYRKLQWATERLRRPVNTVQTRGLSPADAGGGGGGGGGGGVAGGGGGGAGGGGSGGSASGAVVPAVASKAKVQAKAKVAAPVAAPATGTTAGPVRRSARRQA